jgi:UDP:flavonoid glycosyltransferase YjiC (YdhE family)
MRVLISTRMGAGHIGPMIPFAHALLRDNHEVLVTAPSSAAAMVADAGLDHHPIPDPPTEGRQEIFARAMTLNDEEANALVVGDLFVRMDTPAAFPHLLAVIERWRPDVVLHDISDFAAGLAAEAAGVPAANVAITLGVHMRALGDTLSTALGEVRAQLGLAPDPQLERLSGTPSFTLMPERLEDPATAAATRPLRFRVPEPRRPRPLPDWWNGDDRPLVYLTFGSVAPTMHYFPRLYREAIDALSELPMRVLVTIGRERDPADLGPTSATVHVARWIPQADVMPHAAAMVCHGGSGTVNMGLAAGVPMVVVPLFADQPYNARRVEDVGAGLALEPADIAGLADAVRAVLADRSFRDSAGVIARETSRLPTVDSATDVLRRLAQAA